MAHQFPQRVGAQLTDENNHWQTWSAHGDRARPDLLVSGHADWIFKLWVAVCSFAQLLRSLLLNFYGCIRSINHRNNAGERPHDSLERHCNMATTQLRRSSSPDMDASVRRYPDRGQLTHGHNPPLASSDETSWRIGS